jgi:hypothetical protein
VNLDAVLEPCFMADGGLNERLGSWPEKAQRTVDDESTRESPQVVDIIDVADRANGNARRHGVCHSRKTGHDSNDEGDGRAPVDSSVVPVAGSAPIQRWNVNVSFLNDPEVGCYNG